MPMIMGHFQDPGCTSCARRSQSGYRRWRGDAACRIALGRRLGLVTLDAAFEVWHYEQADPIWLTGRVTQVTGMGCRPRISAAAFAGDEAAKAAC